VKTAAQTLRPNPAFDAATVITELRIGEALVSMLDSHGSPGIVDRALIYPPHSRIAPLTPDARAGIVRASALNDAYVRTVDRESAYEQLKEKAERSAAAPAPTARKAPAARREAASKDVIGTAAKSAARAIGSQVGREIIRGILGSFGGRR